MLNEACLPEPGVLSHYQDQHLRYVCVKTPVENGKDS